MSIDPNLNKYRQRINRLLNIHLKIPSALAPSLQDGITYSVLNGGKRLRPLLIYTLGTALGLSLRNLDHAACAVELIHAYSLIHDDLPSVDNSDWRRGKPSCHKYCGEALALLAGDFLQTLAFKILIKSPFDAEKNIKMLSVVTKAASDMVVGQAMELNPPKRLMQSDIEKVFILKTGALFSAALELPGIISNLPTKTLSMLSKTGRLLGLAYQIRDDARDNECRHFWKENRVRKTYLENLRRKVDHHLATLFSDVILKKLSFYQLLASLFTE